MKKALLFLVLLTSPILLPAQFYDANWVSGARFGNIVVASNLISFNSIPISINSFYGNTGMSFTNITLSDKKGNFLCYSNGIRVVNNQYSLIEDGDSLSWNELTSNYYLQGNTNVMGMIGIPDVVEDSVFYLIYNLSDTSSFFGVSVQRVLSSIVNFKEKSGYGKVLQKNTTLWTGVRIQELSACQHGNGRDWWVFAQEDTMNAYHRALLGPDGFSHIDTQRIGYKPVWDFSEGGGQNLFTPDGAKYIDFDAWNGIRMFDFNRCTGQLSNPQLIAFDQKWSFGAGAAVSPNSRFLYVSSSNAIVQYDLWDSDIKTSADTVALRTANLPGFSLMDLMMDGRIYVVPSGLTRKGHFIRYPNRKGAACEVVQGGVDFPNRVDASIPHFPNYRLGADTGSPCDTLGVVHKPLAWWRYDVSDTSGLSVIFTDNSWYMPETWQWYFGNPDSGQNTSMDTNAVHQFTGPGTYYICLTVCNSIGCDTMCRALEIKTVGTTHLQQAGVSISPNPASDFLQVDFPNFERGFNLFLINTLGQVVLNTLGQVVLNTPLLDERTEVYVGQLKPGVYFAQLLGPGEKKTLGTVLIAR